jgi:anti-sigma regulatory factor (Ser/Thr protein kinase)
LTHSTFRCDIHLPLSWSWIEGVRSAVAEQLCGHEESLRDAAIMVASELAENVVKYGESIEGNESGRIQMTIDEHSVRIVSTNGVRSESRLRHLSCQLRRIAESAQPEALYLGRMRELLEGTVGEDAQMGLYRMVCEGGFRLSHSYQNGVLTIVAERPL